MQVARADTPKHFSESIQSCFSQPDSFLNLTATHRLP